MTWRDCIQIAGAMLALYACSALAFYAGQDMPQPCHITASSGVYHVTGGHYAKR
jgi:hypothetical protein